jgi:predicted oxidoreductase
VTAETPRISPEPRPLGTSGISVFPIAYGSWRLTRSDGAPGRVRALIDAALDAGIRLFDHADIYGGDGKAEEAFGNAVAESPRLREEMVFATKCGIIPGVPYDSSAAHIARSVEGSLRRLRVERIDLYQIHRPDLLTHPAEVAGALGKLRAQGKIRWVGVSNHTPAQLEALRDACLFPIITHQPELSAWALGPFRDGVLDQCMRLRMTPLAWSPLAGGRLGLTAEEARRSPDGPRLAALIERLDAIAAREGAPRSAVAIAFLLAHPAGIIPILGTQRPERIREAAEAFRVRLTRADWYGIVEASQGTPLP